MPHGVLLAGNYTGLGEQQFVMVVVDQAGLLDKRAVSHAHNRIASTGPPYWPARVLHAALLARPWNTTQAVVDRIQA
jgi:hypothetical protein